jgi:MFS family permease
MLLGVPLLDELGSGLPVAGAPALQHELFGSFAALSFVVFTAPQLVSFVLEPPILLFASRFARARAIGCGLIAYGLALLFAAAAGRAWLFAVAWTLVWIASGVACAGAQAELMDREHQHRERAMAEWTLAAAVGDLLGPLLLAAAAVSAHGFRLAWVVSAAAFLAWGLLMQRRSRNPAELLRAASSDESFDADTAGALSFRMLLTRARENPRLVAWLFGTTLCSLMDETLVAFCALWMRARFGSDSAVTLGVVALMLGGFVGLLILHRLLLSLDPRSLLLGSCIGSALALGAWLLAGTPLQAAAALTVLGACAAAHYPLAQAAAYRALPSSSSTVAALSQLFGPVDLLIPVAIGLLADRFGLDFALLGLLVQPLGLTVAACWRNARGS